MTDDVEGGLIGEKANEQVKYDDRQFILFGGIRKGAGAFLLEPSKLGQTLSVSSMIISLCKHLSLLNLACLSLSGDWNRWQYGR